MPYIDPGDVISPKTMWRLVDVILDRGEGEPAYSIGMWERRRRIGFRWNGNQDSPLGNPQSRGLPTWVILDPALNKAVVKLVEKENPEKAGIVRAFLGLPVED
ncbi:hypothetical protein [Acidisoma cladoniae]|uniref:hypothetical protein n=1 Tax=Acidisoma cladoniae TaxID=3040935 RepID=UPI00254A466E|nr:hypothetical protein [Acidisoma sp. PAMC 29798]